MSGWFPFFTRAAAAFALLLPLLPLLPGAEAGETDWTGRPSVQTEGVPRSVLRDQRAAQAVASREALLREQEAAAARRLQIARADPDRFARPTFGLPDARRVLLAQLPDAGLEAGEALDDGLSDAADPIGEDLLFDDEAFEAADEADDLVDDAALEDLARGADYYEDVDPLEAINRPIFQANMFMDRWILRPVVRTYIETIPEPGRHGIDNALQNLKTPVILVNDLLQGEMSRAGATLGRFFINTFFGLAGFIDVAEAVDLPGHDEDFGQTLGSYGVGGKPYLMLPFLGPSNPRDLAGRVGDYAIDPLTYLTPEELSTYETLTTVINDRASIINQTDRLEATSVDFYAAVRSFYYQNRDFEIANGRQLPRTLRETQVDDDLYEGLEEDDFEALEEDAL